MKIGASSFVPRLCYRLLFFQIWSQTNSSSILYWSPVIWFHQCIYTKSRLLHHRPPSCWFLHSWSFGSKFRALSRTRIAEASTTGCLTDFCSICICYGTPWSDGNLCAKLEKFTHDFYSSILSEYLGLHVSFCQDLFCSCLVVL